MPPGGDLVEWVASFVPTIEEHHPNVFCLHIFGIDRHLKSVVAELGYFPAAVNIENGLSFTRPFEPFANELILDASAWNTKSGWYWEQDFYTAFFDAVGSPKWHGRNFDALNDSIAGGGINKVEVPYRIVLSNVPGDNAMVNGVVGDLTSLFDRFQAGAARFHSP
jgi:RNAse (barnase) inhibitor barstar